MGAQTQELLAERQVCPVPRPAVTGDDNTEVRDFKIMKAGLEKYGYTDIQRVAQVVMPLETKQHRDRIYKQHAVRE